MGWPKGKPNYAKRKPLAERFWAKVQKAEGNACWLWTGTKSRHIDKGYGALWGDGRAVWAHRVAWELHHGPIPEGMVVDHVCRNGSCVRIDHLRLVTPTVNGRENNLSPFAKNARKTHCKHGHAFTVENTAMYPHPTKPRAYRVCLTCWPQYWMHAIIPREPPPGARKKWRKQFSTNSSQEKP